MLSTAELVRRLLLATVFGALVGIEREVRQKPAGFRTNILIALGACVFTIASLQLSPQSEDPTRIAAQIVTGIGFLGAGAIMRTRDGVHGVTTAATVWVNAAVGIAAGGGLYRLVFTAGAIALVVLIVIGPIEGLVERNRRQPQDPPQR
jgi:putative Mg2+ transporter-C (MgtC) family protein